MPRVGQALAVSKKQRAGSRFRATVMPLRRCFLAEQILEVLWTPNQQQHGRCQRGGVSCQTPSCCSFSHVCPSSKSPSAGGIDEDGEATKSAIASLLDLAEARRLLVRLSMKSTMQPSEPCPAAPRRSLVPDHTSYSPPSHCVLRKRIPGEQCHSCRPRSCACTIVVGAPDVGRQTAIAAEGTARHSGLLASVYAMTTHNLVKCLSAGSEDVGRGQGQCTTALREACDVLRRRRVAPVPAGLPLTGPPEPIIVLQAWQFRCG